MELNIRCALVRLYTWSWQYKIVLMKVFMFWEGNYTLKTHLLFCKRPQRSLYCGHCLENRQHCSQSFLYTIKKNCNLVTQITSVPYNTVTQIELTVCHYTQSTAHTTPSPLISPNAFHLFTMSAILFTTPSKQLWPFPHKWAFPSVADLSLGRRVC